MKNTTNKNAMMLLTVLVVAVALIYKTLFATPVESLIPEESSNAKVDDALNKISSINFDMSVLNDPKFGTFKSIESALPSVGIGKDNPFVSVLGR